MKYLIDETGVGQRLDVWLAAELEISRSQAQKMIKEHAITIPEHSVSAHHTLKFGETVIIEKKLKVVKEKSKSEKIVVEPEIIKETSDYIVINKPAGLLMHGTEHDERSSVADWLVAYYPKIAKIGEDPIRPGIVHRLDKDASGLVVVAKTQNSFDDLKKQFQTRKISKQYQALVYGDDLPREGEINFRIDRSSKGYRMAARPANQAGKIAITEFNVKKIFYNYTLLNLIIKTGRTHQIRAHLAAYNHPIVGDDLYGGVRHKLLNKKFALGRIFLVATDLSFTDLKGKKQSFSIPLPDSLEKVLATLKEVV
jgi:23S rRNA pseudouridine1911/1915/1917 synthase